MAGPFKVTLTREAGYRFRAEFDEPEIPPLRMDEPPPLGVGVEPSPTQVLASAVGDCLSASLLYCLSRAHVEPTGMRAVVEGETERNEQGRLRIRELRVRLEPEVDAEQAGRLARCVDLFEDFCIVTQSVRAGIDVQVEVAARETLPDEAPAR